MPGAYGGRTTCPVCDRRVSFGASGNVWHHKRADGIVCNGSGRRYVDAQRGYKPRAYRITVSLTEDEYNAVVGIAQINDMSIANATSMILKKFVRESDHSLSSFDTPILASLMLSHIDELKDLVDKMLSSEKESIILEKEINP